MAGYLCTGVDTFSGFLPKESRAYCEGAYARTQEVTPTNPHAAGSDANVAWAAGVADKAAGTMEGCCAAMGAAATP